ncbi:MULTISPECIES: M50 family metallopeptidase [Paenibacillus]|uniref:Membrane protein n=1 Tax=Paenibacillus naphthalenovorans TaxID=162209 RepID=A0A0U2VM44_9BACL|nr:MULTISPECIES: M50 family metallopeptidase [Paenibacillus]ALS24371.1 membrane protein [Paenibacillus naphthalenovorans]NTZ20488.1 M50 family peptidase [Paenibacillus sp. JMULE4]SDJ59064.1 Peptidase M50B-like [Paenibacillus naphthalenovorans]
MSNLIKTVLFLMASAFLTHLIPFNHFFRSLNTMIHEFAHAIMTLALSGHVMFIELYANHSGVTYSQISSGWSLIPISLAGYTFASLFAWFMFYARAKGKERLGLQTITLVAILSLVLFVRNEYGIMWLIGFVLLNIVMLAFVPRLLRDGYYLLLSFLMLEEAVFGSFSLVLYAMQDPAAAGDATNLAQATLIPALGWAIFFTVFSLWCASRSLRLFFGGRKPRKSRDHTRAFQPRYEE